MSCKRRAWWPAIPYGGQEQRAGKNQQNECTSSFWNSLQHDLSRAMPWALPEHIQAQKASPTAKRPEIWSAGHVEGPAPPELQAFNHVQRAEQPEPQKAMSIQPGCCNGTSPQVTRQAAQNCSSEHRASALLQQGRGPAARQPHAVYAALFLSSEQQRLLLDRVPASFCNVRGDHMTLLFGPSPEQQAFLPLGKTFELSLSGMVKDNSTQAVAVQLPEGLTAFFAGAAPHITISFADGCTAKQAGDLVRSAYDGEDEPGTCCEVWPEPLVLSGHLGLKLSDGRIIFRADITQDPTTAAIGAQCCSQPQSSRAEASVCFRLQQAGKIQGSERSTTAAVGSQWWLQSSAAYAGASGQQCHSHLARRTVSYAGGHCSAEKQCRPAAQPDYSQQWAAHDEEAAALAELDSLLESLEGPSLSRAMPPPVLNGHSKLARPPGKGCNGRAGRRVIAEDDKAPESHPAVPAHNAKHDAAAVAELDSLLESLKGPPLSRAMPLPLSNGHSKSARPPMNACNGQAGRRATTEDPEAAGSHTAAPVCDAKHVGILSALQRAQPAGLVELWKQVGQSLQEKDTVSSASSSSSSSSSRFPGHFQTSTPQQTAQVLSPAAAYSASNSTSALTSPVDGLGSKGELMCPSEALTVIQSRAGRAAAVAAAVADAELSLTERAQYCQLADTERRAFWMHRNAREVLCQASAEAEQAGKTTVARELAMKSREQDRLAAEARLRANEAAYGGFNRQLLNRWKVDLHGLHVDEALQVLENHLLALGGLNHPGGTLIQVITGMGRHSTGGVARILPAVMRYLTEAGYQFSEEHNNPGVICVPLGTRRHPLSYLQSQPQNHIASLPPTPG